MWPSEGSVAQEVIAAVAAAGIQWIASDEEILTRSTEGWVARDAQGHVQRPELLYQPWRVESGGQKLQMIFRDHALSDLIGFNYQRYEPQQASDDLIGKLEAIGRATEAADRKRPSLVSIILDGENCWEYYPDGGVQFLRLLYQRLAGHGQIKPVRIRDYLAAHPPTESVNHLFAGSWISHNFAIWIGHPACNRAWDLLAETRAVLVKNAGRAGLAAADLKRAWEELYIAEGSDWFWWFDDHHSSSQDWLFDELFRKHLQNVYTLLGLEPAAELLKPIGQRLEQLRPISQPTGTVQVRIDGRQTYFEWINAGVYTASRARGTMAMADSERIDTVHFGFEPDRLLLRFDAHGHFSQRLADVDTLRVVFLGAGGLRAGRDGSGHFGAQDAIVPQRRAGEQRGRRGGQRRDSRNRHSLAGIGGRARKAAGVLRRAGPSGAADRARSARGGDRNDGSLPRLRPDHVASLSGEDSKASQMPDLRKDPIVGRWVIVAKNRARRPHDIIDVVRDHVANRFCPFCEGNETTRRARSSPTGTPAPTATTLAGGCAWCRTSSRRWKLRES